MLKKKGALIAVFDKIQTEIKHHHFKVNIIKQNIMKEEKTIGFRILNTGPLGTSPSLSQMSYGDTRFMTLKPQISGMRNRFSNKFYILHL